MLTGIKSMALEQKATINWQTFYDRIVDYLDNQAPDAWRRIFRPLIKGVVIDQGKRWANILGMTFDVDPLFARSWYSQYIRFFPIPIIDTTSKGIGELINKALQEGWSIPQMQNAITDLFSIWESYRTERIARTETIRASNAGSRELFQEWGVQKHEWLSTKDDRTRTYDNTDGKYDHLEADGQVVNIDEPFTVSGESLMFPGDPAGDPGNTINCRCTIIPVVEGME